MNDIVQKIIKRWKTLRNREPLSVMEDVAVIDIDALTKHIVELDKEKDITEDMWERHCKRVVERLRAKLTASEKSELALLILAGELMLKELNKK